MLAFGGAAVAVLVLAGAKTKIDESATTHPKEGPARKVLVIVISQEPELRGRFEDVIAGELALRGTTSVASHLSFPELPQDRSAFEAKLVADGFDAVTVSRLVGRTDKGTWIEGRPGYETDYIGMDYWGAYMYTFKIATDPGYLKTETSVRVRTDFFRASGKGGRLVWSGTSELFDPHSIYQAGRDVGAGVAKALAKAKLI